jgi:hypothetical protein
MGMKENVKAVLDDLVSRISAETATRFVRDHLFTDGVDIPCRRWSILNQFFVSLSGTADARGIRQWNSVGRRVLKGAQALHILIPILIPKVCHAGKEKGREEKLPREDDEESVLRGFRVMPVFRVEDTEGEVLSYEIAMRAFDIASLPLIEVATSLGVKVKTGLLPEDCSAVYNRKSKQIILGTDNPQTFLHELSHAVDAALPERNTDYAFGEIVAELSSCFIGFLYGIPVSIDSTKAYIEGYAGKGHVAFRIAEALSRVERIYQFIETSSKSASPRLGIVAGDRQHTASLASVGVQESLEF